MSAPPTALVDGIEVTPAVRDDLRKGRDWTQRTGRPFGVWLDGPAKRLPTHATMARLAHDGDHSNITLDELIDRVALALFQAGIRTQFQPKERQRVRREVRAARPALLPELERIAALPSPVLDNFVQRFNAKLSPEAQRLALVLSAIEMRLTAMETAPPMWGGAEAYEFQFLSYLEMRDLLLDADEERVRDRYLVFTRAVNGEDTNTYLHAILRHEGRLAELPGLLGDFRRWYAAEGRAPAEPPAASPETVATIRRRAEILGSMLNGRSSAPLASAAQGDLDALARVGLLRETNVGLFTKSKRYVLAGEASALRFNAFAGMGSPAIRDALVRLAATTLTTRKAGE